MEVCLLEEQLWLVVCMESEIRAYRSRRLNALAKWGEVTLVEGFYDYGKCGTCYVFKFHPVISLVTEENKGYPLSGYPKNGSHKSICLLGRLVTDNRNWVRVSAS
jgi:hypothetical protein